MFEMAKRGKSDLWKMQIASKIIFFFNVFLALMIISGGWLLVQTSFGRATVWFGFIMLLLSAILRVARKW